MKTVHINIIFLILIILFSCLVYSAYKLFSRENEEPSINYRTETFENEECTTDCAFTSCAMRNGVNSEIDMNSKNIVGYIHVYQKGEWKQSYDMLMTSIKESGLYENIKEIRLGVVSDDSKLIPYERFNDKKVKIIYIRNAKEYERPTLLHMKKSSYEDDSNTLYFYLHTKGIRWYGTKHEPKVLEWIQSMLDCNITNWKNVINILGEKETYGCNYNGIHYSGNFWWATSKHIQKLSDVIPEYYTAPEDWVLTNKDNMYCYKNCGDDFVVPYDPEMY